MTRDEILAELYLLSPTLRINPPVTAEVLAFLLALECPPQKGGSQC